MEPRLYILAAQIPMQTVPYRRGCVLHHLELFVYSAKLRICEICNIR